MDEGPKRGDKHYRIYCPTCDREGVMAGWRYMTTGKEVPPEKLSCPECNGKIEILGRVDQ
jgi:hypothetical protein